MLAKPRRLGFVALVTAVTLLTLVAVAPAGAAGRAPTQSPPPAATPPPAKAFVLVDVDTGRVLAADNARAPLRVASTFKLLTALIARERVPFDTPVTISPRAAGEPALNINAKAGQVWKASDLFACLFIVSANDAAMALAEQAGPNILNFQVRMQEMAKRLGLADHPTMHDPAGLDGAFSVAGGNFMSARDLAILGRAVLADPVLAGLAREHDYSFVGGDGLAHHIVNHDHFLERYPGAIGLKTGYTAQAGHTLVAAATRNGRTLLAVVLDAPDPVAVAGSLLDLGWFTKGSPSADRLPTVPSGDTTTTSTPAAHLSGRAAGAVTGSPSATGSNASVSKEGVGLVAGAAVLFVLAGWLLVRRRRLIAAGPFGARPGSARRRRRRVRRRRRRTR